LLRRNTADSSRFVQRRLGHDDELDGNDQLEHRR
jgi:hypothetical protein